MCGNTIYGVTTSGGSGNAGTVYAINADGSDYTNLYTFSGLGDFYVNSDGGVPKGGLLLVGNLLYGATTLGGSSGEGVIFAVTTNGTGFTNLFTFTGIAGTYPHQFNTGCYPNGNLVLVSNTLYGTDATGETYVDNAGAIFSLTTNGTSFAIRHLFQALAGTATTNSDGANPNAGLILAGNTFYATTSDGGPSGYGSIFAFSLETSPLLITTTSLPPATAGSAYAPDGSSGVAFFATGGVTPYKWTLASGSLPTGMTGVETNGTFGGVPTTVGIFDFKVKVTDALSDMATQALVLQVIAKDTTPPTLSITNPATSVLESNQVYVVGGKAADNVAVAGVYYQLNGGAWTAAVTGNGWTNWTATVNPAPGTNKFAAYAADTSGNRSATNTVTFFDLVNALLTVGTNGDGSVTPNDNGLLLALGVNVTLTAVPGRGCRFVNWTGSLTNTNATLTFMMASNLTFTANFVDVTPPTNTITAPTNGQHLTNALAQVTGTAHDNWKVAGVWCQLNGQNWHLASTANNWTNWAVILPVIAGSNTIRAYAQDAGGNYSLTSSVSLLASNSFELKLGYGLSKALPMGSPTFTLESSGNLNGRIQISTNLIDWFDWTNFNSVQSVVTFQDPAATNSPHRFYRAVTP